MQASSCTFHKCTYINQQHEDDAVLKDKTMIDRHLVGDIFPPALEDQRVRKARDEIRKNLEKNAGEKGESSASVASAGGGSSGAGGGEQSQSQSQKGEDTGSSIAPSGEKAGEHEKLMKWNKFPSAPSAASSAFRGLQKSQKQQQQQPRLPEVHADNSNVETTGKGKGKGKAEESKSSLDSDPASPAADGEYTFKTTEFRTFNFDEDPDTRNEEVVGSVDPPPKSEKKRERDRWLCRRINIPGIPHSIRRDDGTK